MCSPNKNHYGVHFITATCKNTKLWTWNCWKQQMKRETIVGIGLDQNLLVLFIFQAICRYNLFRAFFEQKINSAHKCTHRYSWLLSWLFSSLDLVWDKFNFSVSLWHKVKTKLLSFFYLRLQNVRRKPACVHKYQDLPTNKLIPTNKSMQIFVDCLVQLDRIRRF